MVRKCQQCTLCAPVCFGSLFGELPHYRGGSDAGIDGYSARALARVWKAQRFSWWMTTLLHTFPDSITYDQRLQDTDMEYLFSSERALGSLAENSVGLPF